jgi:hypothetical protein
MAKDSEIQRNVTKHALSDMADALQASHDGPGIGRKLADYFIDRIVPDIANTITDKIIPQGADEVGNLLMNGSAYLPWPGAGQNPPVEAPQMSYLEELDRAASMAPQRGYDHEIDR